jgi:hypothetical protein
VTTLIGKGLPKPALMYWSAKTVAEWVADNAPRSPTSSPSSAAAEPAVAFLKELPWQKRDTAP